MNPFPGVPPGDRAQCTALFRRFLREVLVAARRYKLEHLSACLQMCLAAPTALLDIRQLVGPMQSALTMGLRYPRQSSCSDLLLFALATLLGGFVIGSAFQLPSPRLLSLVYEAS